ncbi:MAG: beta-galactosidase, partial [Oscillospiraceae bacterium]
MYYGAAYYPEHWPEERWPVDAKLMREAGVNLIRVAEFAWAKIEPKEGVYNFGWLDRALDVFYKEGIQVVMCTPTPTPPKWLMDKHPSIYKRDENGLVLGFGSRRHYCYNSEVYREYSAKIAEKVAKHY